MMINKIIVEGPNNVGKSTFINTLKSMDEFKDWLVIHMSGDDDNSYEHYDKLLGSNEKVIFDRAYIGELVYPSLSKRDAALTFDEALKLARKYKDNVLYIFVTADMTDIPVMYIKKCESQLYDEDFVRCEIMSFNAIKPSLRLQGCKIYDLKTNLA